LNKNAKTLGKLIKKERISHSVSVEDVAKLLNVCVSSVYRMEKGERKFQPKHIAKLKTLNFNIGVGDWTPFPFKS